MGNSAESPLLDLLNAQLQTSLGEFEPLGDQGGQLPDPSSLLSQNFLGVGGSDDDLGSGGGGLDCAAGVTVFGKLSGEEFVKFGAVGGG